MGFYEHNNTSWVVHESGLSKEVAESKVSYLNGGFPPENEDGLKKLFLNFFKKEGITNENLTGYDLKELGEIAASHFGFI